MNTTNVWNARFGARTDASNVLSVSVAKPLTVLARRLDSSSKLLSTAAVHTNCRRARRVSEAGEAPRAAGGEVQCGGTYQSGSTRRTVAKPAASNAAARVAVILLHAIRGDT
ncbi:MAG: hypothetical protein EOO41_00900 [Methanobacteriota archaeon]|nr:MAG: hypothetical protein EOO41_00900 [Euryarchaeota archaeon]